MISTLARSGSSYTTANLRYYDAWGQIRQGATSGDPSQRYCANLGHKQDDESGLVYMRARYYEPSTGRFVSEDPTRDGINWFVYCMNQPITNIDQDGKETLSEVWGKFLFGLGMILVFSAALDIGDLITARNMLDQIFHLEGYSESWATMLATYSEKIGGTENAFIQLHATVQSYPNVLGPSLVLARKLLAEERHTEARPLLLKLAQRGIAEAAFYLGVLASRQGDFPLALHWMRSAYELNPTHEQTKEQIAAIEQLIQEEVKTKELIGAGAERNDS